LYAGIKKFKLLFAVVIATIGVLFAPSFLDFSYKKSAIEKSFEYLGYGIDVQKEVKINLLPVPEIELNSVIITNSMGSDLIASKVSLRPTLFTIFSDAPKIKNIKFVGAEMRSSFFAADEESSFTLRDIEKFGVNDLELKDVSFVFDNEKQVNGINSRYDLLEARLSLLGSAASKDLQLSAKYSKNGQQLYLKSSAVGINEAGESKLVKLSIQSDAMDINFVGNAKDVFVHPQINGPITIDFKKGIEEQGGLFAALSKDKLKLQAELKSNDDVLSLEHLKFSSVAIKNGEGQMVYNIVNGNEIICDLKIEEINLDAISQDAQVNQDENFLDKLNVNLKSILGQFDFQLPKDSTGMVKLKVSKIIAGKKTIDELYVAGDILRGDLFLNSIEAKLPADGIFSASGSVKNNGIRPKFEGSFTISSPKLSEFNEWIGVQAEKGSNDNLEVVSDIMFMPNKLKLSNTEVNFGGRKYKGGIIFKNSNSKLLEGKVSLRFSELNLDEKHVSEQVDKFITALYVYDLDKSGKEFTDFVQDYQWLRSLPMNISVEMLADKALYHNTWFQDFLLEMNMQPSKINLNRLELKNEFVDLNINSLFKISGLAPELNLNIEGDKLDIALLSKIFPSVASLDEVARGYYDEFNKKPDLPKEKQINYISGLNFFGANNFTAAAKIFVNNLVVDSDVYKNVNLKFNIDDGVIAIQNLSGNFYQGDLQLYGNIIVGTAVPTFSLSYALNNFNPGLLLNSFYSFAGIDGFVSMSGTLSSSGIDYKTIAKNFIGKINLLGKKVVFKGFDMGELIKITEDNTALSNKIERLRYYANSGETQVDQLQGKIDIVGGIATMENVKFGNNRIAGVYSAKFDVFNGLVNGAGKISFIPLGATGPVYLDLVNRGALSKQEVAVQTEQFEKFLDIQARRKENQAAERADRNFRSQRF
jgi:hypothetical protein